MSTDIYGVRVLEVAPQQRRVRLRILIVDYDVPARRHAPVPADLSHFFQLLWESAGDQHFRREAALPLYDLTPLRDSYDFDWIDANSRRFVAGVAPVGARNHLVADDVWDRLPQACRFRDGSWPGEERLPQFDFDVYVTDPRWIAHLTAGQVWSSAVWPIHADTWRDDEAAALPDLREPVMATTPFKAGLIDLPAGLAFSDDSRYLAVASTDGSVAVYDTGDWSRRACMSSQDWGVPSMMWVPDGHVLVLKDYNDETDQPQWAYDVGRGRRVQAPRQVGRARSRDGRYRVGSYSYGHLDFVSAASGLVRQVQIGAHAGEPVQSHDFSADGEVLFVGTQDKVYIVDPPTGDIMSILPHPENRVFGVAGSPDGSYLAVTGISRKRGYMNHNGHEVTLWRVSDQKIIMGRHLDVYVDDLSWSPDGRWLAATTVPVSGDCHDLGVRVFAVGTAGQPAAVDLQYANVGQDC